MADYLDFIFCALIFLVCGGIYLAIMVFAAVSGYRSKTQFANYLANINKDEQLKFAKKSLSFVSVLWIGTAIGALSLFLSWILKKETFAQYICFGLFIYILIMVFMSIFIYRVPKGK